MRDVKSGLRLEIAKKVEKSGMFRFDQPLPWWDTAGVTNMAGMFESVSCFDKPLPFVGHGACYHHGWHVSACYQF
jgi:hypothetical protein